jgi:predicted neutral ceramidase superfamily lipid hydrolase
MNLQAKYFWIAIVFAGSAGIWLPLLIELVVEKKITFHNIPQNVTTYFVSLSFAGCIDLFLSKIRKIDLEGIANYFLNIIIISVISLLIVGCSVVLNIKGYDLYALIFGLIGVAISYRIWWLSNTDNPNFTPANVSLGGDASKQLNNG